MQKPFFRYSPRLRQRIYEKSYSFFIFGFGKIRILDKKAILHPDNPPNWQCWNLGRKSFQPVQAVPRPSDFDLSGADHPSVNIYFDHQRRGLTVLTVDIKTFAYKTFEGNTGKLW